MPILAPRALATRWLWVKFISRFVDQENVVSEEKSEWARFRDAIDRKL